MMADKIDEDALWFGQMLQSYREGAKVTTSNRYYIQNKDTENIHLINAPKNIHKKYLSPNTRYQRWDFKQFEKIKCRVVKFQINDPESGKQ